MRLDLLTYNESRGLVISWGRGSRCRNSAALHRDNSLVGPQMNSDRAVAIAKAAAEAHGWVWQEPLHVTRRRQFFLFGPISWHITTNAMSRGDNVRVFVDERSGRVKVRSFVRY